MQTLTVNTPSHSYPIFIGRDLLSQNIAETLRQYIRQKAAIITNETVAPLYLVEWQKKLDELGINHFSIILPDGEVYKNWQTLNLIFDGLLKHNAERKTTLIALGGGVIGDTVGFAAAVYQRGAPFIQVPTTLLSQVDSSVGGKTAVNHPLGKNMVGAFYQPQAVFADLSTLSTLPPREFSAGMAEVIKYALLGDAEFLVWLEKHMEDLMQQKPEALGYAVYHCCKMKAEIVAADEKEQGIRAWLNLGHTFGHAIEAEMGYGVWLHGEAVAAGAVLACRLSQALGKLSEEDTQRAVRLFARAGLPTEAPVFDFDRWMAHMKHDKKVSDGTMNFISLNKLGEACITPIHDMELLRRVLPV
ncbi:MAG: 3-dehydroquinate synthase [Neisseria sp.]|uniref:3-dehydroquinate synthase n=1 Tax=Neisseria sp. TaxID=192066 RepID=UPI0026DCBFD7|nr:3-dehydroquinate synthase [Neisseria sp.]MDO4641062.1 3-dehydroquinate synthase [Neisseria sp.]